MVFDKSCYSSVSESPFSALQKWLPYELLVGTIGPRNFLCLPVNIYFLRHFYVYFWEKFELKFLVSFLFLKKTCKKDGRSNACCSWLFIFTCSQKSRHSFNSLGKDKTSHTHIVMPLVVHLLYRVSSPRIIYNRTKQSIKKMRTDVFWWQ